MSRLLPIALFFSIAASGSALQLVQNGGFESGDLSGWTNIDGSVPINEDTQPLVSGYARHTGDFGADNPGYLYSNLYQSIATVPGQKYLFSAWAYTHVFWGGGGASVRIQLGDQFDEIEIGDINPIDPSWTLLEGTFVADSTVAQLGILTSTNHQGSAGIDDISVQAVPEPATMAAIGLGAFGVLRRRKRA